MGGGGIGNEVAGWDFVINTVMESGKYCRRGIKVFQIGKQIKFLIPNRYRNGSNFL